MRRNRTPGLAPDPCAETQQATSPHDKGDHDLLALGERIRSLRASRGMSRKDLARHAGVSERYLAVLEGGAGNASVLLLRKVASALDVTLPVVLADVEGFKGQHAADFAQMIQWLARLSDEDFMRAREVFRHAFAPTGAGCDARNRRIALIGLRGAGKSTLGRALAEARDVPFIELHAEIEREAGTSLSEIHALYGQAAYRRYELRALERTVLEHDRFVLAAPGSLVSQPATFNLLLTRCYTVWVRASPEEHMARVVAQGDIRPMEGSGEAMADLRHILHARAPLYARADLTIDTSGEDPATTLQRLRTQLPIAAL
ncbi:helix-turn-helix transcriptional regulator [Cupriavidus pauculus]|uniref:Shikimate kinase n=1 Tax=Cupriavidus pauculus TaxID=82633 RepID=A0A2N5C3G3_9BURK|nr:helix-turn-helix transcriptional regulator [Cupriavidus pauculus]PLP96766.1 transcriptional regulator [Cupriavidus pauculus]